MSLKKGPADEITVSAPNERVDLVLNKTTGARLDAHRLSRTRTSAVPKYGYALPFRFQNQFQNFQISR